MLHLSSMVRHLKEQQRLRTGDTLCAEDAPIVLEAMDFPAPVIGIAVEPKTQKDLDKLGIGLQEIGRRRPDLYRGYQ